MQVAVRPLLPEAHAHLLLLPLSLKSLVPLLAELWLKQVGGARSERKPMIKFEAAKQTRFTGSNSLWRSMFTVKARCLV